MSTEDKNPGKEQQKPENGKEQKPAPKAHTPEGTIIHMDEKMWVEGTGNNKHMAKGQKFEVTKVHGERLIQMKAAVVTTAPTPKVLPKKKKKAEDSDEDDE